MNRVGMVPDGSHSSIRTGLDLCEVSTGPVIYSHTCMRSVWDHERNITDEQARACAATGGVIGITGVGIFLGPNDIGIDALIRHLDYALQYRHARPGPRACPLHTVRDELTTAGFTVTTLSLAALGQRPDGSPRYRLVLARKTSTP